MRQAISDEKSASLFMGRSMAVRSELIHGDARYPRSVDSPRLRITATAGFSLEGMLLDARCRSEGGDMGDAECLVWSELKGGERRRRMFCNVDAIAGRLDYLATNQPIDVT